MVDEQIIELLHNRWEFFCQRIKAKNSDIVWEWIKSAYTGSDRYYHNLNHLHQCFQVLDSIPGPHLPEIELALWFHDIVYKTVDARDNEAESYELAKNAVGILEIPNGYLLYLENMILATKHDLNKKLDYYGLMLDIDLSILGQAPEIYQQYEDQIRLEYGWVSTTAYCNARINILEKFLNAKNIYRTEIMREKFETQAKENLKNAIIELRKKIAG